MIKTKRLCLRRASLDDLEGMHKVFSNPKAMRYWDCLPYTERSQTRDFLDAMMPAGPPDGCDFVVEYKGCAIGKAGVWEKE